MKRAATIILVIHLATGCDDSLDQRLAIVTEPRVIAVIAEPAEAKPGAMESYRALVAGPDGPVSATPRWDYCFASKAPTEDNAVSTDCIGTDQLIALGRTEMPSGTLPMDGCIRFGPDVPGAGFRPRAADATGGYYQPVRVAIDDHLAFGLARITCKLPFAPGDVAFDYDHRYVANANPTLEPFALDHVPADRDVEITARWPASAVETYLYYDPLSQTLVERREAMRVSWFATGGTLPVDATAVGETETATEASITWHTPASGPAWFWIVLRDSRGGIATQALAITVE